MVIVSKNMQIHTAVRDHYTPVEWPKSDHRVAGEDVERQGLPYVGGGMHRGAATVEEG